MTSDSTPTTPISPAACGALALALKSIFCYKRDLERFVRLWAKNYPTLLAGMDFTGYKWATADEFVDRLMENESTYGEMSLRMMKEVSQLSSFPGLKRHENAEELIAEAEEAVGNLKRLVELQSVRSDERSKFEEELLSY